MSGLSRGGIEALGSPLARRVEFHEEIGSTQERAGELAREGAPHGTLVVSGVQKGGRGRLGRLWGSPEGGLWMSVVLRPGVPLSVAGRITQTAVVGVAKALRELGVTARIKWPNDLMAGPDERKICGILAASRVGQPPGEASPGAERPVEFVTLGVGINANLAPEDLGVSDREVTTLRAELGREVELLDLLGTVLRNLASELERLEDFRSVLEDWRRLDCTLGRRVQVRTYGETLEGEAVDLSPEGALLLKTRDGIVALFEGEIEQLRL